MDEFDYIIAMTIFIAYLSLDWLYTIYTIALVDRKKLLAANIGIGIYLLGAFGVINYVGDWRYIIPMCAGGWIGTFLSVWHQQIKDK